MTMQHDDDAHLADVDAGQIFALTRPDDKLLTLYIIYCLLGLTAGLVAFLPLYFRFKTLRYRFDREGVAVSYGLLWRRETYLTYARIQDIHVSRNIFERWLGLGTVKIQTASGSARSTESIVGLRQYDQVRNFLYARMRGHKRGVAVESGTAASEPLVPAGELPSVERALAGILEELRGLRKIIEERRHV